MSSDSKKFYCIDAIHVHTDARTHTPTRLYLAGHIIVEYSQLCPTITVCALFCACVADKAFIFPFNTMSFRLCRCSRIRTGYNHHILYFTQCVNIVIRFAIFSVLAFFVLARMTVDGFFCTWTFLPAIGVCRSRFWFPFFRCLLRLDSFLRLALKYHKWNSLDENWLELDSPVRHQWPRHVQVPFTKPCCVARVNATEASNCSGPCLFYNEWTELAIPELTATRVCLFVAQWWFQVWACFPGKIVCQSGQINVNVIIILARSDLYLWTALNNNSSVFRRKAQLCMRFPGFSASQIS